MNKDKLLKAADKLAKAYRDWIMANAEYNSLLSEGTVGTYIINFAAVTERKKTPQWNRPTLKGGQSEQGGDY
jgi:hypothetical protein